jgi:uncharacterized FAD-dependent dehydrogenase
MKNEYDVIIIGSGPAGLGAAFHLAANSKKKILIIDKSRLSTGGLRNDCKQNYTYPVGFPTEYWEREEATDYLNLVAERLNPNYEKQDNIGIYMKRAEKLGVTLLKIKQSHVGTDRAGKLIKSLMAQLTDLNVEFALQTKVATIDYNSRDIIIEGNPTRVKYSQLIIAPGRGGFRWLQERMEDLGVHYMDNVVDIGIRLETRIENYPIVSDYYDPKFIFPNRVRTFCANSGAAYVVREKYEKYYSVNGHSLSLDKKPNGLINFAMLKTITLTDPVVSGHQFGEALGQMAMQLSDGKPMTQRIGDFRMGRRSKTDSFNGDLYDFKRTLKGSTPGDIALAIPAKILRHIWRSLKMLDTIVPGVLHPSTIIYYPEIKTYANKPNFLNKYFMVKPDVYMIGDGAGTSRGITGAWASGIRAAKGILS